MLEHVYSLHIYVHMYMLQQWIIIKHMHAIGIYIYVYVHIYIYITVSWLCGAVQLMLQQRVILNLSCDVGIASTITMHLQWAAMGLDSGKPYRMQTYRVPFTSENTYQSDSSDCRGWREEPHLESPGSFSCLANNHMCQTSPPTQHISHIPQECLLFYQVKRMNPMLHCAPPWLWEVISIRLFHLVQFVLCPVISFSAVRLKVLVLPVSIYVFMG